ncbi:MAG: hypothetical protein JWP37_2080 [Mucilaginibacter sp.]|nr:hypothetical protein [Mucilaginibacter sp.]
MATFTSRNARDSKKASDYFSKMHSELDLEKYKLAKYQELFQLSSFQNMHDADLAYFEVYSKCAKNSWTKEDLLNCLEQEERLLIKHPNAFNSDAYKQHVRKAINDIKQQLNGGALDYLYV